MTCFKLLSHNLTDEQINALENMGVDSIIDLTNPAWSAINPELESLDEVLAPFKKALALQAKAGDYLLAQGDFGATYEMVNFAKNLGVIPIYATTKREIISSTNENGEVIKTAIFKHIRFRKL